MMVADKPKTDLEVKAMAHEIFTILLPDSKTPIKHMDVQVFNVMVRESKSVNENYVFVNRVLNTVFEAHRNGVPASELENRILLELLWCGYWQPSA